MLKKYSFSALFILMQFFGIAQTIPDSNYIDIASIRDSAIVVKKTLLFFDSNSIATPENLLNQNFVPLTQFKYKKHIPAKLVAKTVYLQIALFNSSNFSDTIFFFPGSMFDRIIFYEKTTGNILRGLKNGPKNGLCQIIMAPGENKIFILTLNFCRHDLNYILPQIIQTSYLKIYKSVYQSRNKNLSSAGFLLSGILFMMIIFIIVNYSLTDKREFIYYLCYAFLMFLLVFFYALLDVFDGRFTSFFNGYLDLLLLVLGNVFYFTFSRYFLDTKTHYKILDKIFKSGERILLFFLVAFTIIHFFTAWYLTERALENVMKIIILSTGIIFISFAFKQKQRLLIYLATGSAIAILFSIISLAIILLRIPTKGIFTAALFYHDLGLVFALAFFLLGLTYKNRKELIERIKDQEALKLSAEKKDFETQIAIIKAQQEERNRISADMHDDLGAGMTTIRLYSELAKSKIGDNSIPEIEKISVSANELLNKMNAIIWSMSSSNDSLGNMIAYIRSYSLEYFENTGITCNINLPEDLPNIAVSGIIRRNVFLVVKEALNNILKHAKATQVDITLERVPDGLKLFIKDNGNGIDFEKLRQFGNGLKNMKKRMEDIGINFSIENNSGTLITLHRVVTTF